MKELLTGFIFFALLIVFAIWVSGGKNKADLSSDNGYEPCKTAERPLWNDC